MIVSMISMVKMRNTTEAISVIMKGMMIAVLFAMKINCDNDVHGNMIHDDGNDDSHDANDDNVGNEGSRPMITMIIT